MNEIKMHDVQEVVNSEDQYIERMAVPGGWLYTQVFAVEDTQHSHATFVPCNWEAAQKAARMDAERKEREAAMAKSIQAANQGKS